MEMPGPSFNNRFFSILMSSTAFIISLLLATQAFLFEITCFPYTVLGGGKKNNILLRNASDAMGLKPMYYKNKTRANDKSSNALEATVLLHWKEVTGLTVGMN